MIHANANATAPSTASVKLIAPVYAPAPRSDRLAVLDRYRRWKAYVSPRVIGSVHSLQEVRPLWFGTVRQAILDSVARDEAALSDTRWLHRSVAKAAIDFFEISSDILPSPPHIYRSRRGDFIAEFKGAHGTLTTIVATDFVVLFAVVDGTPIEKRITDPRDVREEVRTLATQLATGSHGEVAATD